MAKIDLLVLDDWGMKPMTDEVRRDILEVFEDRVSLALVLITSQPPVCRWHEYTGDPTIADAILDRVVQVAHEITMKGQSMRRRKDKKS